MPLRKKKASQRMAKASKNKLNEMNGERNLQRKNLGLGLGLRSPFHERVLKGDSKAHWFEALTENYFGLKNQGRGNTLKVLEKVRENYPVVFHGVSLSIGSTSPLHYDHLDKVRALIRHIQPEWVSDHFCFTGVLGLNSHELLPLPYTRQVVEHISRRILEVQDYLKRPMVFENVSSYLEYRQSEMQEWEFISEIVNHTGCKILLDVNNIYVSSQNHDYKPMDFIRGIPLDSVWQIHLAGHNSESEIIVDTHDSHVIDEVWDIYCEVIQRTGPLSTLLEWDQQIPEYPVVETELFKVKKVLQERDLSWS